MHPESYNMMKGFVERYIPQNLSVLDVGGSDVNGSYRNIFIEHNCIYKTLDWNNSDYIVKNYDWTGVLEDFDVIISGQTFEHDSRFWLTLENIRHAIKRGGWVILIMPSKGFYHAFPVDCYRFYPDSAIVFADILNAEIVEVIWNNEYMLFPDKSKVAAYQFDTYWGDLGMIFKIK